MSRLRRLVPSLNALLTFEAVVRLGTFAKAAEEAAVTGPAVSRTIGRLENHLGVALFKRTPSGAHLTEQGKALYESVAESFTNIEDTVLRLQSKRSERQTVVLSASSAFATHWFMPRLGRFQDCFPKVDIRFQLISGPLAGPVEYADIAMRFDHPTDNRSVVHPLMPEILLPIRASHYEGPSDATANDFRPMVDRVLNLSVAEPDWSEFFSDAVSGPNANSVVFSDYTVVVQAALLGQGIALGWLNVVSHQLAKGSLKPTGSNVMTTGRTCQLVTKVTSLDHPYILEICDWISKEYARDIDVIDAAYPSLELSRWQQL